MYQRRYPGEDWKTVSEETARYKLSGYYNNVDVILSELQAGHIIQTPWAQWHYLAPSQMLHCFENSTDTVIAESIGDAIKVWEEQTGENWAEDYADSDEFTLVPDDRVIKVFNEADQLPRPEGCTVEKHVEYGVSIQAQAGAWAQAVGRGFLCSTEY